MTGNTPEQKKDSSKTAKLFVESVGPLQNTVKSSRNEPTGANPIPMVDEHSVMRGIFGRDPDAVPILQPSNSPTPNTRPASPSPSGRTLAHTCQANKIKARGPRPQNSLNSSYSTSQYQANSPPARRGVASLPLRPNHSTAPSTKRPYVADPKIQVQNETPKRLCVETPVVDIPDDADELMLAPQSSTRKATKKPENGDPFSNRVAQTMRSRNSGVLESTSEYTTVEALFSSKRYAKRKAVYSRSPDTDTHLRVNGHYKGTARPLQHTKAHLTTSPHWALELPGKSSSRNRFIDENGHRRGSSPSEDELASKGPSDDYSNVQRAASPGKLPLKTEVISDSQESQQEMEFERSIPPSKFSNTSRSRSKAPPRKKLKQTYHRSKPISIKSIVSDDFTSTDNLSQMIYSSDGIEDIFEIYGQDLTATSREANLSIPLQRITSIHWSTESTIVFLKCSKLTRQSNPNIAINFSDKDGLAEFIGYSRDRGVTLSDTERIRLERIFEKRLEDRKESLTRPSTTDEDQELDLLEKRRDRVADDLFLERRNLNTAKPPNLQKRLAAIHTRVVTKGSAKQRPGDHSLEDELVENQRIVQEKDSSDASMRNFRKQKSRTLDEVPVTRNSRRSLPKSQVQTVPEFIFPDEPLPQPGFSKTHGLGEPWKKPLVFPSEGKKKTTVEWGDLERLDEGEYLNDNLLGFYLRFLEHDLEQKRPEVAKTVYWFNTYFFASLTQNVKGKGKINYDAVRKWTRSVDLFNFDYAVVPINENHHWYLAIICNLPALKRTPISLADDDQDMLDNGGMLELDEAGEHDQPVTQDLLKDNDQSVTHDLVKDNGLEDGAELPRREADPNEQLARESFACMQIDEAEEEHSCRVGSNVQRVQSTQNEKEKVSEAEVLEILGTEKNKGINTLKIAGKKIEASPKPGKSKRKYDPYSPTIMTLDSLGLTHPVTIKILKTYLQEEAKDKRGGMTWDDKAIHGMTANDIPHQQNYWDCGLFVLGYASKFYSNPREFVTKMCLREYDEVADWSTLQSPSNIRSSTRDLIFDLHRQQHPKFYMKGEPSPKVSAQKSITQQKAQSPMPFLQSEKEKPKEEAKKVKAEESGEEKLECHWKQLVKASPELPMVHGVVEGEVASQAISIDDSAVNDVKHEPTEVPKEANVKKLPGAFPDAADESDDQALMIPDSQEG